MYIQCYVATLCVSTRKLRQGVECGGCGWLEASDILDTHPVLLGNTGLFL